MTNSAPRIERESVSSGETSSHRSAWGQKVRQPRSHEHKTRLAYVYWLSVALGIAGVLMLLFPALLALRNGLFLAAGFYAVLTGHILFMMNTLRRYRKHYRAAFICCDIQQAALEEFKKAVNELQDKNAVMYAQLLLQRGHLALVPDELTDAGAVADSNHSSEKEGSATVIDIRNPKGAA